MDNAYLTTVTEQEVYCKLGPIEGKQFVIFVSVGIIDKKEPGQGTFDQ